MNTTVHKLTSIGAVIAMISVLFAGCCVCSEEDDDSSENVIFYMDAETYGADIYYISIPDDAVSTIYLTYPDNEDFCCASVSGTEIGECTVPGMTLEYENYHGGVDCYKNLRLTGTPTDYGSYEYTFKLCIGDGSNFYTYPEATLVISVYTNRCLHTIDYYCLETVTPETEGLQKCTYLVDDNTGSSNVTVADCAWAVEGKTFIGWGYGSVNSTTVYQPGDTVSVASGGRANLFAKFSENTTSTSLSSDHLYVVEGESVTFTVTGSCNNGATYSAIASTTGGNLSKTTGIANGNMITFAAPLVNGSTDYTVTVTSNVSNYSSSSAYVNITVVDKLVLGSPTAGTPTSS